MKGNTVHFFKVEVPVPVCTHEAINVNARPQTLLLLVLPTLLLHIIEIIHCLYRTSIHYQQHYQRNRPKNEDKTTTTTRYSHSQLTSLTSTSPRISNNQRTSNHDDLSTNDARIYY